MNLLISTQLFGTIRAGFFGGNLMRNLVVTLVAAILFSDGNLFADAKKKSRKEKRPRTVKMLVTGYCPCEICCENWSGWNETATGDDARICDGVAADPRLLPYRTKLRIPGVGIREVDDTGGRMRQSAKRGICHIDVRFHTHKEAKRFGRKWLKVLVISTP